MTDAPIATHQEVIDLLKVWIARQTGADAFDHVQQQCDAITHAGTGPPLYMAFSGAPRIVGKAALALLPKDREAALRACPRWDPTHWSVEQATRTLFVLHMHTKDAAAYVRELDQLYETATLHEAVALYQALPVLHHPARLVARAQEGVRSSMTSVFEAVALRNAYPAAYFDEDAWNQLIVKCLFVGVRVDRVIGLDERVNEKLAAMLLDYAHERWAAQRSVDPQLWRLVGPRASDAAMVDLTKLIESENEIDRQAAALALSKSMHPQAKPLLDAHLDLAMPVASRRLTWDSFVREHVEGR